MTGDNVDNLASIVEKYRLDNGIPLGNPKQEIVDYICGNWPHFCNKTEFTGYLEPSSNSTAAFASRVAAWVTRLWNLGADNFAPDKEAQRRAEICSACDLNRDFRAGGCSSCVQGVDRLAFVWLRGKKIVDEKLWHSLRACKATGAHLQAAVFAQKQPDARDDEKILFTPQCWRKEA